MEQLPLKKITFKLIEKADRNYLLFFVFLVKIFTMLSLKDFYGSTILNLYKSKDSDISPDDLLNKINKSFNDNLISEEEAEKAAIQLDSLIEKAQPHKYFKREGTAGNYKYYYTKDEYDKAKGKGNQENKVIDFSIYDALRELSGIRVNEASTGTIYVENKETGDKIRISDHEPNWNAPRSTDYEMIYTKDAGNKKLKDDFEVVELVAEKFDLEVSKDVQDWINQQKEINRQSTLRGIEEKKRQADFIKQRGEKIGELKKFVDKNKKALLEIEQKAEEYGEQGSTGDKRRKRRKNFFKQSVLDTFGVDIDYADFKLALNKNN